MSNMAIVYGALVGAFLGGFIFGVRYGAKWIRNRMKDSVK